MNSHNCFSRWGNSIEHFRRANSAALGCNSAHLKIAELRHVFVKLCRVCAPFSLTLRIVDPHKHTTFLFQRLYSRNENVPIVENIKKNEA